ncbi:hypothetical protein QYM36_007661 [Artemia franciscana]|uniref:RNA helicase n=1 Tax=Artemia franciscana TaxID=6661 RepID=A0AA88IN86_ARTSF|nr:hypothetical protein QYM36_007661 [Artemia franciscana]
MITKSIADLKERGGSSRQAILKYIMANFQVGNDAKVVNMHLKQALKRCLANGIVINPKGTGVTDEDLPSGIDSFDPARWRSIILANIKKSGYTQPTPVQKSAVPVIMKKGDLMMCVETASGKTTSS